MDKKPEDHKIDREDAAKQLLKLRDDLNREPHELGIGDYSELFLEAGAIALRMHNKIEEWLEKRIGYIIQHRPPYAPVSYTDPKTEPYKEMLAILRRERPVPKTGDPYGKS